MDISHLETWSREALEAEARRIGVWKPHTKQDSELMHRIRAHHGAPLRRAGRLFRKAFSLAREIAAPMLLPEQGTAGKPGVEKPTAEKRDADEQRGAEKTHGPKTTSPASAKDNAASTSSSNAQQEAQPAVTQAVPQSGTDAKKARPRSAARRAKEPTDATLITEEEEPASNEPIPTRTMARLLAAQGHPKRALAIYQKLLRKKPDDGGLAQEIQALKQAGRERAVRSKGQPASTDDDSDEGGGKDTGRGEVVFVRAPGQRLVIAWSVSTDAAKRAESILGRRGKPTARVVVVRPAAEGGVLKETFDLGSAFEGEGSVHAPQGSRVTAAIGVLAGGRFVSVAHADPQTV